MEYRQFFSLLALTCGATTSFGLILSIPSIIVVEASTKTITLYDLPEAVLTTVAALDQEKTDTLIDTSRETVEAITLEKKINTPVEISDIQTEALTTKKHTVEVVPPSVFVVPFYSQLTDITAASWKKVGCGITSLAMLIAFYEPDELDTVDSLLQEGIDAGAYSDAGWTYNGLIGIANKHGLSGTTHDYGSASMDVAFKKLTDDLVLGPVMASVHYTFKPTNPIPHLVIINGIKNDIVYYNDPAEKQGGGSISVAQFKSAWKKRYIEFHKTA